MMCKIVGCNFQFQREITFCKTDLLCEFKVFEQFQPGGGGGSLCMLGV